MNEALLIAAVEQQASKPATSGASSIERLPVEASGQGTAGCCTIATCS